MSSYMMRRTAAGVEVMVHADGMAGCSYEPLDPRHDFMKLGGDGRFEFGVRGPGSRQLAFAVLSHALRGSPAPKSYSKEWADQLANRLCVKFATDIVETWDPLMAELIGKDVVDWVERNMADLSAPVCDGCGRAHL